MNYKSVLFGVVTRNSSKEKEILVGSTYKPGYTAGTLIVPGTEASYPEDLKIISEVLERTGINTKLDKRIELRDRLPSTAIGVSYFAKNGNLFVRYIENGYAYEGSVYMLNPLNNGNPISNPDNNVRDFKYKPIIEVKKDLDSFTPACHVLLRMLEEDGYL